MHIRNKIHVLIIILSPTYFGDYCTIFRVNFFIYVSRYKKLLPEDGAIIAEIFRKKDDK